MDELRLLQSDFSHGRESGVADFFWGFWNATEDVTVKDGVAKPLLNQDFIDWRECI